MTLTQTFPKWNDEQFNSRCNQQTAERVLLEPLQASGIPKRYHHVDFGQDFPGQEYPDLEKRGLFIYGPRGTGKTHFAVALAKEWMFRCYLNRLRWHRVHVRFASVSKLLLDLRNSFNNSQARREGDIIADLVNAPLLVLDDLGTEQGTDYAFTVLYVIINERYNEQRPIIVTSNFSLDELASRFSDAITSRLYEMCSVASLSGRDWRVDG